MMQRHTVLWFSLAVLSAQFCYCQSSPSVIMDPPIYKTGSGRVYVGPSSDDFPRLAEFLQQEQVTEELALTSGQIGSIKAASKLCSEKLREMRRAAGLMSSEERREFINATVRAEFAKGNLQLDEILTPSQRKRMMQLVYRVELEAIGWRDALTFGRIGEKLSIYENQLTHLSDRCKAIEIEMERKIAEVRRQAELQVLDELTPEQRVAALELVGDFFDYKLPTAASQIISERRKDAETP